MSGSYYTLDVKYNSLLAMFNSFLASGSNLNDVLTAGNDANGLSMTDLNNVDLVTINGSAYPPLVAGDNLGNVLTNGNDAGALSMTNVNDIALTTINGAAYPPPDQTTITVTEDTTNAVYYPVFTSGSGATQTLSVNATTTPISVNPSTGDFIVDRTIKVEGSVAGNRIGIGSNAGLTQGTASVAVGNTAGSTSQGRSAVAIGDQCGNATQADRGIGIGALAANVDQNIDAIAIGTSAGQQRQGTTSIAIGVNSGTDRQGRNCIAIGNLAGNTLQSDNTIVLNATGVAVNGNAGTGRFYVAPMRGVALGLGVGVCKYDPITFEMVYSTT